MKNKILIVEDNPYKFYTLKQLLETKMRIPVRVIGVNNPMELLQLVARIVPNQLIMRPTGGAVDMMEGFLKRGLNRRNCEITVVVTSEGCAAKTRELEMFTTTKVYKGIARAA